MAALQCDAHHIVEVHLLCHCIKLKKSHPLPTDYKKSVSYHPSFGMTATKTLRSFFSWHTSCAPLQPATKHYRHITWSCDLGVRDVAIIRGGNRELFMKLYDVIHGELCWGVTRVGSRAVERLCPRGPPVAERPCPPGWSCHSLPSHLPVIHSFCRLPWVKLKSWNYSDLHHIYRLWAIQSFVAFRADGSPISTCL